MKQQNVYKKYKTRSTLLNNNFLGCFPHEKEPHGIWVPKQREDNRFLISPYAMLATLPPNTPAMYIGTDGRPTVGVFLVADTFYELPYNILNPIGD
jgi:hypothetical protein